MTLIPELERELEAAVARANAAARPAPRARRRLRVALAPALAAVLGATAALAATGVLPIGDPVPDPGAASRRPDAGQGVVVPGTARLLPVKVADPAGGPPWGLRLVATTRGLGCLQAGRLQQGRLGIIGMDHAFDDDGRFHPLRRTAVGSGAACARLDGRRRLFYNVTASDVLASGLHGGCLPRQFTRDVPASQLCYDADLRNLYYGTLGPQAKSVTYADESGSHTVPTAGPQGAYLIVLPSGGGRDFNGEIGGLYPTSGPITAIDFKDGTHCAIGKTGPVPDESACRVPGYVKPAAQRLTPASIRRAVHARALAGRHGRWTIVVRFRAPTAIENAGSAYNIELHPPHPGPSDAFLVGVTDTNYDEGDQVVERFTGQRQRGLYRGTVTFVQSERPGREPFLPSDLVVGRFSVRVR